jgi:hypothetical protein
MKRGRLPVDIGVTIKAIRPQSHPEICGVFGLIWLNQQYPPDVVDIALLKVKTVG